MPSPIDILNANSEARKGSFLYWLHERDRFNQRAFWEYYNAIRNLAGASLKGGVDRATARTVHQTFQYTLRSVIWHLLPTDAGTIENFDVARIDAFLGRLSDAVDGYFAGHLIDDDKYDDGLRNPRSAAPQPKNRRRGRSPAK